MSPSASSIRNLTSFLDSSKSFWLLTNFVKAKFVSNQKDFDESKNEVKFLLEEADGLIEDCTKDRMTGKDFQDEMKSLMAKILIQVQVCAEQWGKLCAYSDPNVEKPNWSSDRLVFWLVPKYLDIKVFHHQVVLGRLRNIIQKIYDMENKKILLKGTATEICPEYAMQFIDNLISTFNQNHLV